MVGNDNIPLQLPAEVVQKMATFLGVAAGARAFSRASSQEGKTRAQAETQAEMQAGTKAANAAKKSLGQEHRGLKSGGKGAKFAEGHSGLKGKSTAKKEGKEEKEEEEAKKEENQKPKPQQQRNQIEPLKEGSSADKAKTQEEKRVEYQPLYRRHGTGWLPEEKHEAKGGWYIAEQKSTASTFDGDYYSPTSSFATRVRARLATHISGLGGFSPLVLVFSPDYIADMALAGFEVEANISQRVAALDRLHGFPSEPGDGRTE
jgi:hypothetical protein